MKRRLIFGAGCAALVLLPAAAGANEVKYRCADGSRLTVKFTPPGDGLGSADLLFTPSGDAYTLPQAPSADGGRYSDESTEFWTKGKGARLTRNGSTTTCDSE